MKIVNIERVIIVALVIGIIGSVYVTNYVRDHEVYRTASLECGADKSILRQEIEQLDAFISLQESKVEELKGSGL